MELDAAFSAKEEIALEVKSALKDTMSSFGFSILTCLITDLNPDGRQRPLLLVLYSCPGYVPWISTRRVSCV
jgi:hypothetical protein